MSNMKVLREWLPLTYTSTTISESRERNNGKIFLKGVIQMAETLNQNGRIYPRQILEREMINYQKFIKENRALGECDHPAESVIELKNVSHIVREAQMTGNSVSGVIELLDTPCGKILQSLVESGVTLGISSRGVGSTRKQGDAVIVEDDFQLICFDIVSEPSTPGAFMHLNESHKIKMNDLNTTFNKSDRIFRIFNDIKTWK